MSDNQAYEQPATALLSIGRHAPDEPPPLLPSQELDTVETETRHYRHDGWTPAARAAFLDMLAKSGVVTDACREVRRSSQAAYALRNRDPLFATGWDAALSMARTRLADDLFQRAVHGTVDQIWKDGGIVAERHHHDNRLSMAVLNRLDARCDRAERFAAPALRAAANWEAYLAALADDRTADMQAMLAPPPPIALDHDDAILGHGGDSMLIHQLHQLRQGKSIDEGPIEDDEKEPRVWVEDFTWRTNFPPPGSFNGYESGTYGEMDYSRQCTPEERELLDRRYPDAFVKEKDHLQADEAERDAFFAELAEELASSSPSRGDDAPGSGLSPEQSDPAAGDHHCESEDGGGASDG